MIANRKLSRGAAAFLVASSIIGSLTACTDPEERAKVIERIRAGAEIVRVLSEEGRATYCASVSPAARDMIRERLAEKNTDFEAYDACAWADETESED